MLFQSDVVEAANARLLRVAWLTRGMARSVVDDDRNRCCRPFIVRLEASWLRPHIGFTLHGDLAVFTRSAITPPKVNRLR